MLAPYLRKFGQFTIPDFLGERYGGHLPRLLGVMAAILCSFIYVVAQIYGVGLITSRLIGVAFELGIFLGLGGILVCSFLGGMRAVTWTQVAQYIVIIVAYLIPVVWLSVKQTGVPVPQAVYGYQLEKVTAKEKELASDPKELEVRADLCPVVGAAGRKTQRSGRGPAERQGKSRSQPGDLAPGQCALRRLVCGRKDACPRCPAPHPRPNRHGAGARPPPTPSPCHSTACRPTRPSLRATPTAMPRHRQTYDESRRNFLALVFCLMVGTAALPHILMRYYTVPSVKDARESVTWSLFFIFLLYFTAPALAVMVKFEVFNVLIGTPFDQLPAWVSAWNKVDPSLLSVTDVNQDGLLQLNEMSIGGDIIVLATAEIAGLPYVISGLVAAGGLAAALSTADGLLLTIANALSHDVYYKMIDPNASTARRVTISKVLLLDGGTGGRLCGGAEARRHPVSGVGSFFVCGLGLFSGPGAGHLLEACHRHRRLAGHDQSAWPSPSITW